MEPIAGFGWESFAWVRYTWVHGWGLPMESIPGLTGDGKFDGETFLGGLWMFFLGGRGRGRGTPGYDCRDVFAGRREFQTTLFMSYIIC